MLKFAVPIVSLVLLISNATAESWGFTESSKRKNAKRVVATHNAVEVSSVSGLVKAVSDFENDSAEQLKKLLDAIDKEKEKDGGQFSYKKQQAVMATVKKTQAGMQERLNYLMRQNDILTSQTKSRVSHSKSLERRAQSSHNKERRVLNTSMIGIQFEDDDWETHRQYKDMAKRWHPPGRAYASEPVRELETLERTADRLRETASRTAEIFKRMEVKVKY